MERISKRAKSISSSIISSASKLSFPTKVAGGLFGAYLSYKFLVLCFRSPKSLKVQIVFITGAANGLGRQMALKLSAEGAKIAVADIDIVKAHEVADLINSLKGEAIAVECDVTSIESVRKAASIVRTHLGSPNILINNAGIVSGKLITEIPIESIERTMKVNAISHFYTIKEFLPDMIKANQGHIVTIASMAGLNGSPQMTDYCASKYAAVGLDESLRRELKFIGSNVKTTCICPFFIDTGMFAGVRSRFSFLLPVLKEEKVAKRIIDGVRFNEEVVVIPKLGEISFFFRAAFSVKNCDRISALLGGNHFMQKFTGRN